MAVRLLSGEHLDGKFSAVLAAIVRLMAFRMRLGERAVVREHFVAI